MLLMFPRPLTLAVVADSSRDFGTTDHRLRVKAQGDSCSREPSCAAGPGPGRARVGPAVLDLNGSGNGAIGGSPADKGCKVQARPDLAIARTALGVVATGAFRVKRGAWICCTTFIA